MMQSDGRRHDDEEKIGAGNEKSRSSFGGNFTLNQKRRGDKRNSSSRNLLSSKSGTRTSLPSYFFHDNHADDGDDGITR